MGYRSGNVTLIPEHRIVCPECAIWVSKANISYPSCRCGSCDWMDVTFKCKCVEPMLLCISKWDNIGEEACDQIERELDA